MPAKYPGGYTVIDLKGIDISDEAEAISDPDIIALLDIIGEGYNKPVYLSNFSVTGTDYPPAQAVNTLAVDDLLRAEVHTGITVVIEGVGDSEYQIYYE